MQDSTIFVVYNSNLNMKRMKKNFFILSFLPLALIVLSCMGCSDTDAGDDINEIPGILKKVNNVTDMEGVLHFDIERTSWYINVAQQEGSDSIRYNVDSTESLYPIMDSNRNAENYKIRFSGKICEWVGHPSEPLFVTITKVELINKE